MPRRNRNEAHGSQDEDEGVSLLDVLEEEAQSEEDTIAVLGDSDAHNCTYALGYVSRQAVYACATCTLPDMAPAGICLACSYRCHDGHELYELYTKRNFKCDCGNSKFPGLKCKLARRKSETNPENLYSQNFHGRYCICSRPYPDPDNDTDDEMYQCIVCEDWLHGRHLGHPVPDERDFEEMVCETCMGRCEFLWYYAAASTAENYVPYAQDDVKNQDDDTTQDSGLISDDASSKGSLDSIPNTPKESTTSAETNACPSHCRLADLQANRKLLPRQGATFWPIGWRNNLCACSRCQRVYEEKQVGFLLDDHDTIRAYEERGRAKNTAGSTHDQGMEVLSRMNRTQQVELLAGYNEMKEGLKDYLRKFANNGKVVREEDIQDFFAKLSNKRRKTGNHQYHCK